MSTKGGPAEGPTGSGSNPTLGAIAALPNPPRSQVAFVDQYGQSLTTWGGDGPAQMTDGYGGWEEVQRPHRTPITTFGGSPLMKLQVPLLFDGFRTDTSVEGPIHVLESMARPRVAGEDPPWVRVSFPGGHLRSSKYQWVIQGLDWGDALLNDDGARTRQSVTVQLTEYSPVDFVAVKSPSKGFRSTAPVARRA